MKKHPLIKLQKQRSKYLLQSRFKPKVVKTTYTQRENEDWLLIIGKFIFF